MKEFLDFTQSNAVTMIVNHKNEVIAAATCQLKGRLVYSRGFMVAPAWQGRINARRVFQQIMILFRARFKGQADLIYGEARTESAKMQYILEEIGCKPVAILPRKDIFYGKRETEIISAWYYQNPQPNKLYLTLNAAQIAEKVLHYPIPFLKDMPDLSFTTPTFYYSVELRETNDDSHLLIKLPSGSDLSAIISYKSSNSEKVQIQADDVCDFYWLCCAFVKEIRQRKIEYAEIYIDAREYVRQNIAESLGFKPTGFLAQWYAFNEDTPHDYVVYTKHWYSTLPDCPIQCTEQGEFLKSFVDQPTPDESLSSLVGSIEKTPEINSMNTPQYRVGN